MTDAIHIRPVYPQDAATIARIQVDGYRSAYAGILPQDYLNQFSYDDQESNWIQLLTSGTQHVVLVAATGDPPLADMLSAGRRHPLARRTTRSWWHSMFAIPFTGTGSVTCSCLPWQPAWLPEDAEQ
ncbi:MAG: hypothetical protein NTU91_07070 [Chloroflexi bacterium]|nr:hypothetical protein [Chloroflexota bacterium]